VTEKDGITVSLRESNRSKRELSTARSARTRGAASACPAVAQTWQTWEPELGALRSAQKWNCAPNRASTRNRQPSRMVLPLRIELIAVRTIRISDAEVGVKKQYWRIAKKSNEKALCQV
jgi:hypothetical protein